MVIGEKSKRLYNKLKYNPNDYHIFIPKEYKPLNLTFGVPEKNRMICYRKSFHNKNIIGIDYYIYFYIFFIETDIFKTSFMPKVLDKYPNEEFPEAVAMVIFKYITFDTIIKVVLLPARNLSLSK